jgi:hypothetical protein
MQHQMVNMELEGEICGIPEVLSQHLPEGTEKTMANLSQDSLSPG